jgi:hypothetical protein
MMVVLFWIRRLVLVVLGIRLVQVRFQSRLR